MPAYTFHTLSPADFEELCRDLLDTSLKLSLQSFACGPDKGIDLLHASHNGNTVVQCKHLWKSGYSALKSVLKKEEYPKISRLSPTRYILCTSISLTKGKKEELQKLLTPFITNLADIIGQEDLNAMLREHPEVEKQHHKLWLTSSAVLERILHNGLAVWNDMEQADIERKLELYVPTDAYDAARAILDKYHYVIISGIPGIGKTTLAQVLVTHFLDQDYNLVSAREDVQQAIDGFDATQKQIIYYDDFLGRSSFADRLGKNEETGLLRLFREVHRSPNKRAVMTTREYILQEARQHYELLNGDELDLAKCIVEVASYTRAKKARILYNHLYFSSLPDEYVDELVNQRTYLSISDHRNYIPRVVEWMTNELSVPSIGVKDYPGEFLANLDNPTKVWSHAFDKQIGDRARSALYLLATLPATTELYDLEQTWRAVRKAEDVTGPGELRLRFMSAMRQLDGSFVQTGKLAKHTAVSFHNASVRDFIMQRIGTDPELATELLTAAVFFEQLETLVYLDKDGKVAKAPTGIVGDGAALKEAIDRTMQSQTTRLVRVQYTNGEHLYLRPPCSLGTRFSRAATWEAHFKDGNLLQYLVDLVIKLEEQEVLPGEQPVGWTGFLNVLMADVSTDDEKRRMVIDLLVAHLDAMLSESSQASDWTTWGEFVTKHLEVLDSLDWHSLQNRVVEFCEYERDSIIEGANSSDDIRSGIDQLEEVARVWEVDIDGMLEDLQLQEEERRSREPTHEKDDYEYSSGRMKASGESDAELDRLFQSLCGQI